MNLMYVLEAAVEEGFMIPLDVAASAMSQGYIVEGLEDRIDGFRVFDFDEYMEEYEAIYE